MDKVGKINQIIIFTQLTDLQDLQFGQKILTKLFSSIMPVIQMIQNVVQELVLKWKLFGKILEVFSIIEFLKKT